MNFGSLVSGTPPNFNGFRVLAALLHGTLVVGASKTAALNRGHHLFGRAAITLGIGPHSSSALFSSISAMCNGLNSHQN